MEKMIQVDIAVRKTVDIPLRWHLHPYLAHLFHQRISIITTQKDHLSCQGLVLRLVAFTVIPNGFDSRISSVGIERFTGEQEVVGSIPGTRPILRVLK